MMKFHFESNLVFQLQAVEAMCDNWDAAAVMARSVLQAVPRERGEHGKSLNPHFLLNLACGNLWTLFVIYIHAGLNAMKTLWRSIPNG